MDDSVFFQKLGEFVASIFLNLEKGASSMMFQQIIFLVSITFTIQIMLKGYAILFGKSNEPVRELIWEFGMKMFIIAIATNLGGWLTLVTDAMNGLHEWAGGGISLYAELDRYFTEAGKLADAVEDKGNMVSGFFYSLIVYVGFIFGAIPAFLVIVITDLTLKILIMLAPFMLFAKMYGWLQEMFTQWLKMFFTNTLTVLIVSLLLSSTIEKIREFQIALTEMVSDTSTFLICIQVLIIGILIGGLVKVATTVAKEIGVVSIDSMSKNALSNSSQSVTNTGKNISSATTKSLAFGKSSYSRFKNRG